MEVLKERLFDYNKTNYQLWNATQTDRQTQTDFILCLMIYAIAMVSDLGSSVLVRPLYMCVRGTGTETPDCGSWWLCIKQTAHWCYYRSSTADYLAVRSIALGIAAKGAADWTDGRPPNTRVVGGDLSAHTLTFTKIYCLSTIISHNN